MVITSGERRSTTETQSSQSTHRAPNQELENHRNLWLATGNSEEPKKISLKRRMKLIMTGKSEWEEFFDAHAPIYEDNIFTKSTLQEVDFLIEELAVKKGGSNLT